MMKSDAAIIMMVDGGGNYVEPKSPHSFKGHSKCRSKGLFSRQMQDQLW